MPKSIRVDEKNYQRLAAYLRPRESFNDAVGRLLNIAEEARRHLNVLEEAVSNKLETAERLGKGGG